MPRQRLIFQWGFGISLILLLASIASGAPDFARHGGDIRYGEMPLVATWATLIYLFLNLPVVVIGTLVVAVIRRVFGLSVPVALILWPPICVYLSYFWWQWLSDRLTRATENGTPASSAAGPLDED